MKKFNINDHMYIQITDNGWTHLRNTVGEGYIKHCIESQKVEVKNEIWYKLQCWGVFDLFPSNFGGQPLFKTTVIFDDAEFEDL